MKQVSIGIRVLVLLVVSVFAQSAWAATCTSVQSGRWDRAATWSCTGGVTVPGAADSVIINSPYTVTLQNNSTATNLTINAGATLDDGGSRLTISGNAVNNGNFGVVGSGGRLIMTGAGTTISGNGTFADARLYIDANNISLPAGSTMNFSSDGQIRVGSGTTGSFTIAGSVTDVGANPGNRILRVYSASTLTVSGTVNAPNSYAEIRSGGTVVNNGAATLQYLMGGSATTSVWTNAANSTLNVSGAVCATACMLNASAAGNTVNYSGAAQTVYLPSGSTYANLTLSGSGAVTVPTGLTVGGNFTMSGTTSVNAPAALTVGGDFTVSAGNTFTPGTGTVTLNGATVQNIGSTPISFNNLSVTNTANPNITLSANVTVTGTMTGTVNLTSTCPTDFTLTSNGGTTVAHSCNLPVVSSINTASVNPTAPNTVVTWTVIFTQSVTGVDVTDFTLAQTGGATGASITSVVNSTGGATTDTNWTVTANTGAGTSGSLGLDLVDDDSIINATSVKLGGPGLGNGNFTGQVYTISLIDHVLINAPTSGLTLSETAVTIEPHTTGHGTISGAGTISLSTDTGLGDWTIVAGGGNLIQTVPNSGSATYTFGPGETSVTLGFTYQTAGTVVLNVADATGTVNLLTVPTEVANTITFNAASYVFTSSACQDAVPFGTAGQCALVSWSPQVAGQDATSIYITLIDANSVPRRMTTSATGRTRNMELTLSCHNPIADAGIQATFAEIANPANSILLPLCTPNGAQPPTGGPTVAAFFAQNAPSAGPFKFNYADVGMVELWVNRQGRNQFGTSGAFVVKPGGFVLSGIQQTAVPQLANPAAADALGQKFVKAGEAFSVTATATTCAAASATCTVVGAATPNYGQETSPESVKLTQILVAPAGGNNPAVSGAFGAFASGVVTGNAFAWPEVGIITLTPSVGDADYLGVGDTIGSVSGNVGRFYAAQFALSAASIINRADLCPGAGCPSSFSYMGEKMNATFTLTAQAVGGTTTQNYNYSATAANNFAKLDPTAIGNPLVFGAVNSTATPSYLSARLDTSLQATGNFVNGNGTANVVAPLGFTRNASADGPYAVLDIGIAPVDGDGAQMATYDLDTDATAGNDHARVATTEVRYGRTKVSNAYGSELLKLTVPVWVQYWNGTAYRTNTADSLSAPTLLLGNYQGNLVAGQTALTNPVIANGLGQAELSAPGANNTGSVDLSVSAPSYLPGSTARATFGVYRGNDHIIYQREY